MGDQFSSCKGSFSQLLGSDISAQPMGVDGRQNGLLETFLLDHHRGDHPAQDITCSGCGHPRISGGVDVHMSLWGCDESPVPFEH